MKCKFLLTIAMVMLFVSGATSSYSQTTATITARPGDTVCANTPVRFRATTTDTAAHRFSWRVNGAVVGTPAPTFTTTTLANGDTVWCYVTDTTGATIIDTSNYIVMTVNPNVAPSIITGGDSVCLGHSLTLMDSVSGGVWSSSNPASLTISSTGVVTAVAPGMYRVTYKITTGSCADSVRLRIRVDAPASALVSPGIVCMDSVFFLTDSARGGVWNSSDTNIAAIVVPFGVFQGVAPGTATISYNLTNSCGTYAETTTVTIVNCDTPINTGVSTVSAHLSDLSIYPNPSTGAFAVTYNTNDQQPADVTISNLLGQQVAAITLTPNKEYVWQSGLASGVYFMTLHTASKTTTEKIIINR